MRCQPVIVSHRPRTYDKPAESDESQIAGSTKDIGHGDLHLGTRVLRWEKHTVFEPKIGEVSDHDAGLGSSKSREQAAPLVQRMFGEFRMSQKGWQKRGGGLRWIEQVLSGPWKRLISEVVGRKAEEGRGNGGLSRVERSPTLSVRSVFAPQSSLRPLGGRSLMAVGQDSSIAARAQNRQRARSCLVGRGCWGCQGNGADARWRTKHRGEACRDGSSFEAAASGRYDGGQNQERRRATASCSGGRAEAGGETWKRGRHAYRGARGRESRAAFAQSSSGVTKAGPTRKRGSLFFVWPGGDAQRRESSSQQWNSEGGIQRQ